MNIKPEDCKLPAPPDLDYFDYVMREVDKVLRDTIKKEAELRLSKSFFKIKRIVDATRENTNVRHSAELIAWQRAKIEEYAQYMIDFQNTKGNE